MRWPYIPPQKRRHAPYRRRFAWLPCIVDEQWVWLESFWEADYGLYVVRQSEAPR